MGGIVAANGYLIGRAALTLRRYLGLPGSGPRRAVRRAATILPFAVVALWCLANVARSHDSVRAAVGMPPVDAAYGIEIVAIAAALFAMLTFLGRPVRCVFDTVRRRVARCVPRRVANVAGLLAAALVVTIATRDGVIDVTFRAADGTYATAAAFSDPAEPPPVDPRASGGPGSLIEWSAVGAPGRDYVRRGPTAAEIAAFTGRPAMDPRRVYVGLEQDLDPEVRAAIAVSELERVGGFERANLVIALPTGTGWLDAGSFAPMEYLLEGDVVTVAVQYSYLNSPFALVFETRTGLDQATALIQAVTDRWDALPEDARPRLYVHGLSLGAWSSTYGMDLFRMVNDPVDGASWSGPPFASELWHLAVDRREPGSPYVLPEVEGGRLVRFVSQDPENSSERWAECALPIRSTSRTRSCSTSPPPPGAAPFG